MLFYVAVLLLLPLTETAPPSLNLEVVSSTVIRVTCTAPKADRLPLTYLISYQSEFGSGMKEASTQPVELTGLHPFAEYTVSVQARNTGGQLSVNVTGKSTTLSAAPSSPPQGVWIVDALKTHDSLTCTWRLPVEADRNGMITSYFIIVTRVSGEDHQPVGNFTKVVDYPSFDAPTHLRYTVTGLSPQTLYSFRIAAVTSGGTGVFSDSLARKTNLDLYVSMLTIQVNSDTSSTISWAAPEEVDSVTTSYRVYYGVYLIGFYMIRLTSNSTTSLQLSSLTPETPIEVSVTPEITPVPGGSVSRIFFTKEGVPTVRVKNVTVMRINSVSLRVSWTPLSLHEARGWPLYTVIVESTAGRTTRATITRNTSSSTVDVDGLDPSTSYSVRVQVGTSAGTSGALISSPVPSQVIGVSLSRVSGQRTITVNWNKPSSDRPIIRYEVQYALFSSSSYVSVPAVLEANSRTTTIPGLTRGVTYMVRVRAVSDAGDGPYSPTTPDSILAIPNVPSDASGVDVTVVEDPGSLTITVTWSPPQSDVPITGYEVNYSVAGTAQPQLTTIAPTATFQAGPSGGETYTVRVRAVSAEGAGGWSSYTTIAPPSVPTGVIATYIDTSSVTVTWSSDGFNYRVSAQRVSSSERSSQDPVSPPHTITGLDSNTAYTITVEAYTPLGLAEKNINVNTLPEAPSNLNLEVVSSTVIRVTWTAPPNADRLPLTYLISYQSTEFGSGMKEASTQPVELTGLHPFAEYTVSVQARNAGGQLSVIVTGKTTTLSAAPSSPPQSVLIADGLKTHDSLTCIWQLPVEADRNGIITSYFIIATRGSGAEQQPIGNFTKVVDNPSFDAPTHLRYTFNNLIAITVYGIRIAAVTSGGTGVFSDLLSRRTNHDLYVSMLTIRVDSDTSSTISWAAPEGEVVYSYRVYYGVYLSGTFMSRKTSTTSQQLTSLTPETPIEVSVIPNTAQGPGGSVSRIFFNREGVPTVPVKDVTVMRINSVSLRVSWTSLSLHEARGWPLYTVIVESTSCGTTRATVTRNTSSSTVDVDGLSPCTSYSVRVQVGTSAGTSASLINVPVELQAPCVTPATPDSNVGVTVGVFVAGLVVGILGLLLVIGILFGACKLIKQPHENGSKESGSDPNAVEMTQSPAYESVGKAYEDVDHPTQQRGVPKKINEEYAIIE